MNKRTVIISIIICVLGGITAYYFLDTNLIVVITAECAIDADPVPASLENTARRNP